MKYWTSVFSGGWGRSVQHDVRSWSIRIFSISWTFLPLFILWCARSLVYAEGRFVILNSESFITYPIADTYFAPWSPNFTQVIAYVQYFQKTCKLDIFSNNVTLQYAFQSFPYVLNSFPFPTVKLLNSEMQAEEYGVLNKLFRSIVAMCSSIFTIPSLDSFISRQFYRSNCSSGEGGQSNSYVSTNCGNSSNKINNNYVKTIRNLRTDDAIMIRGHSYTSDANRKNQYIDSPFPDLGSLIGRTIPLSGYIWLFDECRNIEEIAELVNVANTIGASSLVFSDTNFIDNNEKLMTKKWFFNYFSKKPNGEKSPQPKMPVLSLDTRQRVVDELKVKISQGIPVKVRIDMEEGVLLDCSQVMWRKWSSLFLSVSWLILALIWQNTTSSLFHLCLPSRFIPASLLPHRATTLPMAFFHRVLLLPCILKPVFHVVTFLFWDLCPNYFGHDTLVKSAISNVDESVISYSNISNIADSGNSTTLNMPSNTAVFHDRAQYLLMLYMGLNTVFYTLLFAILLLLASGYMTTRDFFRRSKALSIALLVSLVYIITSVYQLDPIGTLPALIILYLILLSSILEGIFRNINYLQIRLDYVRSTGIDGLEESLKVKLNIFKVFGTIICIYFALQILLHVCIWEVLDYADILLAMQMILDFLLYAFVLLIFRPRDRILYFSLMQNQESALNVLPMYSVVTAESRLLRSTDESTEAEMNIQATSRHEGYQTEHPIVFLNPGTSEVAPNLVVGTPVSVNNRYFDNRGESDGGMHEGNVSS